MLVDDFCLYFMLFIELNYCMIINKGCLQKKKTSYGGKSSLPVLPPPPPTKVGNKTLGNFLVVLDPLPPYKSREIYSFL